MENEDKVTISRQEYDAAIMLRERVRVLVEMIVNDKNNKYLNVDDALLILTGCNSGNVVI